jgi:hypothetical protein
VSGSRKVQAGQTAAQPSAFGTTGPPGSLATLLGGAG